jgi:hypothetical protein
VTSRTIVGTIRAVTRSLAAAVLAGCLAAAPAAGGRASDATVQFVGFSPLEVRGQHFAPGERVEATLRGNGLLRVRVVHASARGRFVVGFGSARKYRCRGALTVTAVGAGGERAARSLPPIECPAPVAAMTALPGH